MKRAIFKIIFGIVFFILSIIGVDHFMNQGNTDMTQEMAPATFPVVYMQDDARLINPLYGYNQKMENAYQTDTMIPITSKNRDLSFQINTYGTFIKAIDFEVRNALGDRLIENTKVEDYLQTSDMITMKISIKDLLEDGEDYSLCIHLEGTLGQDFYYYTTIVYANEDFHLKDHLDFVLDFHTRTFDKDRAKELTKYLESNSEGDNTTYHKVNIHSSFSQITWGNLTVQKETEPQIFIRRINSNVSRIELRYRLLLNNQLMDEHYNVSEYYFVRFGRERMYLLDYERDMNSIFNADASSFTGNKISLGISDENIKMQESEDGNILAFVKEGCLYHFNQTDNKLALLFGFYDENNQDERDYYQNMDIDILSVDETGNTRFLVYGYMNRGNHEGSVGIACYYFNSMVNTIEEEVYIPFSGSASLLKKNVERLSYVNNHNKLFLLLYDCLYQIDLTGKRYEVIVDGLTSGSYYVSDSNRMIVWQTLDENKDIYKCNKLALLNLNTGNQMDVLAGKDRYIMPLGFMNEDLIYGQAPKSLSYRDYLGNELFLMDRVFIQDERGKILKTYEKDGYYVTSAYVLENQIVLKRRVHKGEGESYPVTDDDQIMNDVEANATKNELEVIATQDYEKIIQIAAKNNFKPNQMKNLTPKQVMYEGERSIILPKSENQEMHFYTFDKYGLSGMLSFAAEAVLSADESFGYVLSDTGTVIWEKSNRPVKNQIMRITTDSVSEDATALANCLDTILQYEGYNQNSQKLLDRGRNFYSILKDNLENKEVLDLTGCSLSSVLYYVGKDIPVMAILNDGNAVLIVGYNELNTVIFNPISKTISKMGMNDSTDFFQSNGNQFFTYVDK